MLEATVKIRLGEYSDEKTGRRAIWANITNVGEQPIDRISLVFEYEYEKPQDVSSEFDPPPGRSIRVEELGRQIEFLSAASEGRLPTGNCQTYLLPPEATATVESIVASLSPERYRLAMTVNGRREVAVPGMIVGGFVQGCPSDSLPEDSSPAEQDGASQEFSQRPAKPAGNRKSERTPLVGRLIERLRNRTQTLEILPPRDLTHGPGFGESAADIQRLGAATWGLKFSGGDTYMLSSAEFMALLGELMMLRWQYDELRRRGGLLGALPVAVPLNVGVSQWEIGEEVTRLIDTLSFGEL